MMTNVKKIGNDFEREFEKLMRDNGFWVHFCAPNSAGAQPADFVAARFGKAYLIDCKTCEKSRFSVSRLEENQINAFNKFLTHFTRSVKGERISLLRSGISFRNG